MEITVLYPFKSQQVIHNSFEFSVNFVHFFLVIYVPMVKEVESL